MSTESEVKQARYSQVEKEADAFDRVIGVRRLKPSEQSRLAGMIADVVGFVVFEQEDGTRVEVPQSIPIKLAAQVCMINDVHIPFPKTRQELDAIFDRLDTEGIEAASRAVGRLVGNDQPMLKEDAKN